MAGKRVDAPRFGLSGRLTPQYGFEDHEVDDGEDGHGVEDAQGEAALVGGLVGGAVGAFGFGEGNLAAEGRGIAEDSEQHEDQVENQSGEDPGCGEVEVSDEDHPHAGDEEQAVGGVGNAVVEELDGAQGVGQVVGMGGGAAQPKGVGDVAADGGDGEEDVEVFEGGEEHGGLLIYYSGHDGERSKKDPIVSPSICFNLPSLGIAWGRRVRMPEYDFSAHGL